MNQVVEQDTVDLGELASALRRRWRWIAGGTLLGVVLAVGALIGVPAQFESSTTVLLRSSDAMGPSALAKLSGLAEGLPFNLGSSGSGADTEIKILTSRAVVGEVVDSLKLQAELIAPRKRALGSVLADVRVAPDVEGGLYHFKRSEEGYTVAHPFGQGTIPEGGALEVPGAVLTPRWEGGPEEFKLRLVGRDEAIDRVLKKLDTGDAKGEVAELIFRAGDPYTAARVPNLLVSRYLDRRRTTDRGVNQHRYEFLTAKSDSLQAELQVAGALLREHQERSGMLDPALVGKENLGRVMALRGDLEKIEVESRSLQKVISDGADAGGASRRVAAYPTFLQNPAINDVLSRLMELETQRAQLLLKRTERDDEVVALGSGIRVLEAQLATLSQSYLEGLQRQRTEIRQELNGYVGNLSVLPGQAENSYRLEREVRRLSETLLAVQTQMVQARLAAITEGGDVRQIDPAVTPRKAAFPNPLLFLVIGLVGGLAAGTAGAIGRHYLSPIVRDAHHAQMLTGVPSIKLQPNVPLLLGQLEAWRGILLIPVGDGARPMQVARQLAATISLRTHPIAVVDLGAGRSPEIDGVGEGGGMLVTASPDEGSVAALPAATGGATRYPVYSVRGAAAPDPGRLRPAVSEIEERYSMVVLAAPSMENPVTAALLDASRPVILVGQVERVRRDELVAVVETLNRVGVATAGVVLHNGQGGSADLRA